MHNEEFIDHKLSALYFTVFDSTDRPEDAVNVQSRLMGFKQQKHFVLLDHAFFCTACRNYVNTSTVKLLQTVLVPKSTK